MSGNREALEQAKQAVVERYGPWTSHRIYIRDDVYTIADQRGYGHAVTQTIQTIADVCGPNWSHLRILDLACAEGLFAIEAARHGAEVVGIEGRESNLGRARFVAESLGLKNVEFVQDDVRNLSVARYGTFDAVMCFGILYHLNAPDVFKFVEDIGAVCTRLGLFGTRVSLFPVETAAYGGQTYSGILLREHAESATAEEKIAKNLHSLDNTTAFELTRASLYNLLRETGFTSVYEARVPRVPSLDPGWVTLMAIKGQPQEVRSVPWLRGQRPPPWPERFGAVGKLAGPLQKAIAYSPNELRHYVAQRLLRGLNPPSRN